MFASAASAGAAGVVVPLSAWEQGPSEAPPLPVRVDLDAARPAALRSAVALGPDLVGLPATSAGPRAASDLRASLGAACELGAEVVLLLERPADVAPALDLAPPDGPVVGVRADFFEEEAYDALSEREDLGLITAADEFASAYRRGAGGLEGLPASISPRVAVRLLDLCRQDVDGALVAERRLMRFLEGHLRPAARRLGGDRAALEAVSAAVGGSHLASEPGHGLDPAALDVAALRGALVEQLPELIDVLP